MVFLEFEVRVLTDGNFKVISQNPLLTVREFEMLFIEKDKSYKFLYQQYGETISHDPTILDQPVVNYLPENKILHAVFNFGGIIYERCVKDEKYTIVPIGSNCINCFKNVKYGFQCDKNHTICNICLHEENVKSCGNAIRCSKCQSQIN